MEWGSLSASENVMDEILYYSVQNIFSFLVSRSVLFVGLFTG